MRQTARVLGVLGGMGPLASAQFMVRLTALTLAERDQDHIPTILWSDPRVPDRSDGRRGPDDPPLPWLLRGIEGLLRAGVEAIAIPCNTAHGWFDDLQAAAAPHKVIHIVDAAAAELRRLNVPPGRVGVMGTAATLRMRLYQDRLGPMGWDCLIPEPDEMETLVTPAIALVKANRVAEAYAPLARSAQLLAARGARAIVLGCTETPIGLQAGPVDQIGVPLIDTIDGLARAAIAWAQEAS